MTALVLAVSVWAVVSYFQATQGWVPRAATPLGRSYGWIGAGLMLILVLYAVRHAAYRGRMGTLEAL